MVPAPELVDRFRRDLDSLVEPGTRIGIAVSGGPDSLALLLLASAARRGSVEAATVDHALRAESRGEAEMVAKLCRQLGVRHEVLTVQWSEKPSSALQERAREKRYQLLAEWVQRRELGALLTAHHADDQAETLLMRLARGAGIRGLAGMRPIAPVPGTDLKLARPLLGWRRDELEALCAAAGVEPARDPTNQDDQFERVRIRGELSRGGWIDAGAVARSAAHLGSADEALEWATAEEWKRTVKEAADEIVYRPGGAPDEIERRIVARAITTQANEGSSEPLRGRELDRLLDELRAGRTATLRGVLCSGGAEWRFTRAPTRNTPG